MNNFIVTRTRTFLSIIITIFLSTSLLFTSCSSNEFEVISENNYLDLNSNDSFDIQTSIIEEAAKRMDKYVIYDKGQFRIASCNNEKVNLSPRLYNYMISRMEKQNMEIEGEDLLYDTVTKILTPNVDLDSPISRLKTRSENPAGGGVDRTEISHSWHSTYLYVYISNRTLRNYGTLSQAAAAVGGGASAYGYPVAGIIGAACGLSSILIDDLVGNNPNGVIVSFIYPGHLLGCIPYSISSQ